MIFCCGGPTDLEFGIVCRNFGRKVDMFDQIWHGLPRGVRAVAKWRTFLGRWGTTTVFPWPGFHVGLGGDLARIVHGQNRYHWCSRDT